MGDEDDYRYEIEDYAVYEEKLIGKRTLNQITRKLVFDSWDELYDFLKIGPHHPLAHVLLFMTRQHRITVSDVKAAAKHPSEFGAAYLRVQAARSTAPVGGWPHVGTLIRTIVRGSTLNQIAQDTSLGLFMLQAIVADFQGDCLHNPALPLQRLHIAGPQPTPHVQHHTCGSTMWCDVCDASTPAEMEELEVETADPDAAGLHAAALLAREREEAEAAAMIDLPTPESHRRSRDEQRPLLRVLDEDCYDLQYKRGEEAKCKIEQEWKVQHKDRPIMSTGAQQRVDEAQQRAHCDALLALHPHGKRWQGSDGKEEESSPKGEDAIGVLEEEEEEGEEREEGEGEDEDEDEEDEDEGEGEEGDEQGDEDEDEDEEDEDEGESEEGDEDGSIFPMLRACVCV